MPFGVLFSFYLNLIHEQPRWIAEATMVCGQIMTRDDDFHITRFNGVKLNLVGEDAVPVGPSGNREILLRHFAKTFSIIRNQHFDLAGIIYPCTFIDQSVEANMLHFSRLLQVNDGIQGIATEAEPTP